VTLSLPILIDGESACLLIFKSRWWTTHAGTALRHDGGGHVVLGTRGAETAALRVGCEMNGLRDDAEADSSA